MHGCGVSGDNASVVNPDAQRLANEELTSEVWQQLVVCMGFSSETPLRLLFTRLLTDARVDELRVYRGAALQADAITPATRELDG